MKQFLFIMLALLAFSTGTKAQESYYPMTVTAADDTLTNVDTGYLYRDFTGDYALTFVTTTTKVNGSGAVDGDGVSLWGRNRTTEPWTRITSTSVLISFQASDTLTNGTNTFIHYLKTSPFRYYMERVITAGTCVVAPTAYVRTMKREED